MGEETEKKEGVGEKGKQISHPQWIEHRAEDWEGVHDICSTLAKAAGSARK